MRVLVLGIVFGVAVSGPVFADPMVGVWATAPDHKGQIAHVKAQRCGESLCGRITHAYDKSGKEVTTPNVGKRLFWDMKPAPKGGYKGKGWLPSRDMVFNAKVKVSGNQMTVRGCIAMICKSQTWTRVKASS
ncbi:MAG: DUF2147 domain-containing protein [Thalassovita sp.]